MDLTGSGATSVTAIACAPRRRRRNCSARPAATTSCRWAALPKLMANAVRGISRVRRAPPRTGATIPMWRRCFDTPQTFLNHVVTPGADVRHRGGVALDDVKETARHLGVTSNDVVLAIATGGAARDALALRRARRPTDPGIGAGEYGPVARPDRRQRNERSGPCRCRCTSTIRWSGCD